MQQSDLTVRVGPEQYKVKEGILDELPAYLEQENINTVLLVHGERSWKKAKPYLETLYNSNIMIHPYQFLGECSQAAIETLTETLLAVKADAIIGIGGGKIMDAVKYAAYKADHRPSILIPTLASNCAPWTPVSVLYRPDGTFVKLDVLPVQVSYLLIEPRLIFDAPREYFIAGMADTLAKWYESDAILAQEKWQEKPMLKMARFAADLCRTTILEKGAQALSDLDSGILSDEFVAVAEVIIGISGLVGGFGDAISRTTIAHEINDAVTMFPETHRFLHGNIVGYGILVQLAVEKKWQEIEILTAFYRPLGIPTKLADIGLPNLTDEQIMLVAIQSTAPHLPVHQLPYDVTADVIVTAIKTLEEVNS